MVANVSYKYGATVIKTRDANWGGVTQGSYIMGDNSIEPDANNPLFQHEYGHYIQSQHMGWGYYSRVGVPSALSNGDHDLHPVEQDANRRAFLYFNKNISGFQDDKDITSADPHNNKGWDFESNILNVDGSNRVQYINYKDPAQVLSLNNLKVSANAWDGLSFFLFPGGPYNQGVMNSDEYNKTVRRKK